MTRVKNKNQEGLGLKIISYIGANLLLVLNIIALLTY